MTFIWNIFGVLNYIKNILNRLAYFSYEFQEI